MVYAPGACMSRIAPIGRARAWFEFLLAGLFFFAARFIATHGAAAWAREAFYPLCYELLLAVFLVVGYAALGLRLDRQPNPIAQQGLAQRRGWHHEAGMGLAAGWAMAVFCLLPMVVLGGVAVSLTLKPANWGWFAAEVLYFALLALAEEVAYRGYGFQRFEQATGPFAASLMFACFYAMMQARQAGSSKATVFVAIAFSLLLSTAYLRTRALWVSWGLNFAWKASRALLFGLAVNGVNTHSPLVQGDPLGSYWLSGGAFGLESSWFALLVMMAMFPIVAMLTKDLDYVHNAPVIEPGGIAVDLDAVAREQHEAATQPAAPTLVQILPLGSSGAAAPSLIPAAGIAPASMVAAPFLSQVEEAASQQHKVE